MSKNILIFTFISFILSGCHTSKKEQTSVGKNKLKFLDEYVVPYNYQFQNTTVGGLSGIDYDPEKNEYYLICDDRSKINPARFYTAKILISKDKIDSVIFLNTTFLKNQQGNFYPNSSQDPSHTPDPEALRHNPASHTFIWSSEGERLINPQKTILENPTVTEINTDGQFIDTFALPRQVTMSAISYGPRQNGVFEGLTFIDNNQSLLVSVESPLYQDGPAAGNGDSTGITRIIKFNLETKKPIAQYAYKIDPVAHAPLIPGSFKINGIADILNAGENQLYVLERSYSTGRLSCTIKLFLADLSGAENIESIDSLNGKTGIRIIPKKLLLNMDNLGIYIDNIEGVTFGPTLSNGKKSLIFIADNNFNLFEKTQVLLFEIE